ncbi:MAG TPA: 3-hydroxyacyl-CoA dehydrogenase NAD-binding domain-containing protein [Candidatus Acidoferrum sp.]|nr:3-hydroxyacyl-CoA dehydrogenase NAD-binding domain-containing protein [Candidatus Acidoferrum sp.]
MSQAVETIAVIGASELGCRVASLALGAGFRTILEDVSPEALERGVAAIREKLHAMAARDGEANTEEWMKRLATARSAEDAAREADLIIECTADELEMKLELFTIFDKFAKPAAILASTTETISISDLAEMTFCQERCVGMRFRSDGAATRVEVATGRGTSDETVERCREVARRVEFFQSNAAQRQDER